MLGKVPEGSRGSQHANEFARGVMLAQKHLSADCYRYILVHIYCMFMVNLVNLCADVPPKNPVCRIDSECSYCGDSRTKMATMAAGSAVCARVPVESI